MASFAYRLKDIMELDIEEQDEELPRDRWFNPHRIPKTETARAVVEDVLGQVQTYERFFNVRKRKRKASDQKTFETTVSAIICDLMHYQLAGEPGSVAITRSHCVLGCKSRYRPQAYGKTLPRILDSLSAPEMAFVEQRVGHPDFGFGPARRTTIAPGSRLFSRIKDYGVCLEDLSISNNQEVIILKRSKEDHWDEGGLQEFDDTPTTRQYREQVNSINAWLAEADIVFDEGASQVERRVDDTDRRLRRIFTNGSFESGGRLFGGFWQQLKKKERLEGLFIDGEEVAVLDFAQMNPRILYGMAKATPPDHDLYTLPDLEPYRSGVKQVMNAMTFATKPLTRMPKGVRQEFSESVSIREVVAKVNEAHPALTSFFFTGIGHRAQFIESQIMVDILRDLKGREIVALPIHDAVVIPASYAPEVEGTMLSIFRRHTGVEGIVREEKG